MADQNDVDLDSVIDRLLEVRGSRPGKQVQLLEAEIRYLCTKAREIFISQPILLELEAPIKVRCHIPYYNTNIIQGRCKEADYSTLKLRSVVIYMDNTTISFDYSNTEDSRRKQIISSSETTLIEENNPWRLFACFLHTRSSTPRTSSSCAATTNVPQSIEYTGSMTNVRGDTISSYGRRSPTASIACPLQL